MCDKNSAKRFAKLLTVLAIAIRFISSQAQFRDINRQRDIDGTLEERRAFNINELLEFSSLLPRLANFLLLLQLRLLFFSRDVIDLQGSLTRYKL